MSINRVLPTAALAVLIGAVAPMTGPPLPSTRAPVDAIELAGGLRRPFGMAQLPTGEFLITEKTGGIRRFADGRLLPDTVPGGPPGVLRHEDGGLLDIVLDPAFRTNGYVYVAFAEGTEAANHTALFRARYQGGQLRNGRVIFRARPDKKGIAHFGGRIAFLPDQTLLLTTGDGYDYRDSAQSLTNHLGKIVRLTRDGAAAAANPFMGVAGALPEIYSYGHRNPQGLIVDSATGDIWSHEHGPRGGDEINRIRPGLNYGWPRTTHGMDYDGTSISDFRGAPGIEPPVVVWIPSIAPSGMALYRGDRYPGWEGDFFVGALAGKHLRRVHLVPGRPATEEVLLPELGARIREVRTGADGFLYILTDEASGRLLRVVPKP